MAVTIPIPKPLMTGPFTRATALAHGVTARMLNGNRFERIFPRVWNVRGRPMSDCDWICAARLAMPSAVHVTGRTRIRLLGLDSGPLRPFHFVVQGDLHIDLPDIFLHRSIQLPPIDDVGVTPVAAFMAFAAEARAIDAIKVGDWLIYHGHMTLLELRELAFRDRWRPGARQSLWIAQYLDGRSRSLKESETRALMVFGGLPTPRSNKEVQIGPLVIGVGDLTYLEWHLVVEYEGSQHLINRAQWNSDIDRYADFRDIGLRYVQVTNEKLGRPHKLVSEVFRQLLRGGYAGPPPVFADRWRALFRPISESLPRGGDIRTIHTSQVVPESPPLMDRGA